MEGGPFQGVPVGSIQVRVQKWDLNLGGQEEEVDQRNVQGVWPKHVYTRGQWGMNEFLILCTVAYFVVCLCCVVVYCACHSNKNGLLFNT
jgi:hypothetical protein